MIDGRASTNNKALVAPKAAPAPSASVPGPRSPAGRPQTADAASRSKTASSPRLGAASSAVGQEQIAQHSQARASGTARIQTPARTVAQAQSAHADVKDKQLSGQGNATGAMGNAALGSKPVGYSGSAAEYAQHHFNTAGMTPEQIQNTTTGRGWVIGGRALQSGWRPDADSGSEWAGVPTGPSGNAWTGNRGGQRTMQLNRALPGDSNFKASRDIPNLPGEDSAPTLMPHGKSGPPAPPAPASSTLGRNAQAATSGGDNLSVPKGARATKVASTVASSGGGGDSGGGGTESIGGYFGRLARNPLGTLGEGVAGDVRVAGRAIGSLTKGSTPKAIGAAALAAYAEAKPYAEEGITAVMSGGG